MLRQFVLDPVYLFAWQLHVARHSELAGPRHLIKPDAWRQWSLFWVASGAVIPAVLDGKGDQGKRWCFVVLFGRKTAFSGEDHVKTMFFFCYIIHLVILQFAMERSTMLLRTVNHLFRLGPSIPWLC
jgi:hypothetical protein